MAAPRLICLDTVLVDVELAITSLPARAGDVRATSQLITTGGGFNAMSAASRHDLDVVYAGRIGRGPFATLAMSSLAGAGIATPLELNEDLDCGVCVVLVEPNAERTFVTAPGAESTLRASDLAELEVNGGDIVLVSGYNVMYPDMAESVLEWLEGFGADVIVALDPATRVEDIPQQNIHRAVARATWLLCNRIEATRLSGETDVLDAVRRLSSAHESLNILVRSGSEGCVVAQRRKEPVVVKGFQTTVVDTTGAGDVHDGVFLAQIAQGHEPVAAARWANAAAAMSVARFGPATSPTLSEVESFLIDALDWGAL
ncbi:MAG: PfkB family carbohydrate kinase [Acidimicrobiales bacterium]